MKYYVEELKFKESIDASAVGRRPSAIVHFFLFLSRCIYPTYLEYVHRCRNIKIIMYIHLFIYSLQKKNMCIQ